MADRASWVSAMVARSGSQEQVVDGTGRARAIVLLVAGALGGCRESSHDPVAPPPRVSAPGSVNPDPGITRYACADGQAITAGYPDRTTAVVTFKDHAYTLKLARSPSGARYVGFGLQWWVEGDHAAVSPLKPGEETASGAGVGCTEVADRSATRI